MENRKQYEKWRASLALTLFCSWCLVNVYMCVCFFLPVSTCSHILERKDSLRAEAFLLILEKKIECCWLWRGKYGLRSGAERENLPQIVQPSDDHLKTCGYKSLLCWGPPISELQKKGPEMVWLDHIALKKFDFHLGSLYDLQTLLIQATTPYCSGMKP